MKRVFLISSFIIFSALTFGVKADFALAQEKTIEINFFYSAICPHCDNEKEFLGKLEEKYPEIKINKYEVVSNTENKEILKDFYEKYNVLKSEMGVVPVTFTHARYFIGFNEQTGKDIENCIEECLGHGLAGSQKIKVPFLGEVDISKMSLPVLTIALAAMDGLNPCAMWILLFLIALLINTRSRKKMWLVAGTFVIASGIVYYLILAAWLNLFLAISYVNITRIIIGIFALGAGAWQIKNFITYNPGMCKVVGLKPRIEAKLKERAEKIVNSPVTWATVGGLVLLALGVNLIEFFCSAGLPAIYTRTLTLSDLSFLSYHLYLLLYTFIFMLDDLIIFSLAIFTLSKVSITEKYSYWATLIGGLLILILGLLLILKPELLMFG